jgi:hypothetical protein
VDGVRSLFANHLPERARQGELRGRQPPIVPLHVRRVLPEIADLIALSQLLPAPRPRASEWGQWVADVHAGKVTREEAIARLEELHAQARSIQRAAQKKGVHRNTMTATLDKLRKKLGDSAVPWAKGTR